MDKYIQTTQLKLSEITLELNKSFPQDVWKNQKFSPKLLKKILHSFPKKMEIDLLPLMCKMAAGHWQPELHRRLLTEYETPDEHTFCYDFLPSLIAYVEDTPASALELLKLVLRHRPDDLEPALLIDLVKAKKLTAADFDVETQQTYVGLAIINELDYSVLTKAGFSF